MARYQEIADSLRSRIQSGEFPEGARLPGISALMKEYQVPGLNTIRAAQQLLVDEGMLETRQGVGAFVTADRPVRDLDVVEELTRVRNTLTTVLTALQPRRTAVTFDVGNEDIYFVLTEALADFARRERYAAQAGSGDAELRARWAQTAEAALQDIETSASGHA
ncbi:MAG: GntR family transcriptional regulator [Streptosporangiaceae bacterium]